MSKSLSANFSAKNALSAPSAPDFTFCIPADCRDANYALLLADRYMRWFEDFDPYGVEFNDRAADLLENAKDLLRCNSAAFGMAEEIESVLEEYFADDDRDGDLYQDGKALAAEIRTYIHNRDPWAKSPSAPYGTHLMED